MSLNRNIGAIALICAGLLGASCGGNSGSSNQTIPRNVARGICRDAVAAYLEQELNQPSIPAQTQISVFCDDWLDQQSPPDT